MASELGDKARRAQMPRRIDDLGAAILVIAPELQGAARDRIVRLALVLTASGAQRMLVLAGRTADEAAEDVIWAMHVLAEAAREHQEEVTGP
jgi:hypothetical protein